MEAETLADVARGAYGGKVRLVLDEVCNGGVDLLAIRHPVIVQEVVGVGQVRGIGKPPVASA